MQVFPIRKYKRSLQMSIHVIVMNVVWCVPRYSIQAMNALCWYVGEEPPPPPGFLCSTACTRPSWYIGECRRTWSSGWARTCGVTIRSCGPRNWLVVALFVPALAAYSPGSLLWGLVRPWIPPNVLGSISVEESEDQEDQESDQALPEAEPAGALEPWAARRVGRREKSFLPSSPAPTWELNLKKPGGWLPPRVCGGTQDPSPGVREMVVP